VWIKALATFGVLPVHFDDLRQHREPIRSRRRATLRELMERMGTPTWGAAMIYLRVSSAR